MRTKLSALVVTVLLVLLSSLAGEAYAYSTGQNMVGFYYWSGYGSLLSCDESHYIEPGIFGSNWTAWTTELNAANTLSCTANYGAASKASVSVYTAIGAYFCSATFSGPSVWQTGSAVAGPPPGGSADCVNAGHLYPKTIYADAQVYWAGAVREDFYSYTANP
jgi:hypothetical protein